MNQPADRDFRDSHEDQIGLTIVERSPTGRDSGGVRFDYRRSMVPPGISHPSEPAHALAFRVLQVDRVSVAVRLRLHDDAFPERHAVRDLLRGR